MEIVSKLTKYEVLGVVGEGAYGVVLKCRNKQNTEIVAIKKFKDSEDDEGTRKTILREVKILRMLKQENIVSLLDAFRRKKRLYLVFEFMQRNLLQVLEEKPLGLDPTLVRLYTFQLCRAIMWCHKHNIVHRDIKPENLLVNRPPDTTLKLCDFGFARSVSAHSSQLTDYVATRWYRAPELLLGVTDYGKPVDVWAIGCIMGELIDSQPLFPGESDIDQLYVIRKVLGPLTENQRQTFLRNPRFLGMKIPEVGKPETLQRRYQGKSTPKALSFMERCLEMDPSSRTMIEACLGHPYFELIRNGPEKDRSSACQSAKGQRTLNDIYRSKRRDEQSNRIPPMTPPLLPMNNKDVRRKKEPKGRSNRRNRNRMDRHNTNRENSTMPPVSSTVDQDATDWTSNRKKSRKSKKRRHNTNTNASNYQYEVCTKRPGPEQETQHQFAQNWDDRIQKQFQMWREQKENSFGGPAPMPYEDYRKKPSRRQKRRNRKDFNTLQPIQGPRRTDMYETSDKISPSHLGEIRGSSRGFNRRSLPQLGKILSDIGQQSIDGMEGSISGRSHVGRGLRSRKGDREFNLPPSSPRNGSTGERSTSFRTSFSRRTQGYRDSNTSQGYPRW